MPPMLLAEIDQGTKWMAIAAAVLTILWATILRPLARKKKDPLARPPSFGNLAQHRSVERQMQNVLVDMAEMARQITAQLDTRATKLELLIREADEKIATLKSATSMPAEVIGVPQLQSPEPNIENVPLDPRHKQIYSLADEGKSPVEISQELNRPSGEIELILALRR